MTTETDWAKVPSGTKVVVWDNDPDNAQERHYLGYRRGSSYPHSVIEDDEDCFAFAKLVETPETDWAAVRSGTKVVVWDGDADTPDEYEGIYIGYIQGRVCPHWVVVVRDEGEVGCFTHAKIVVEPATDWAAVRSGTAVYVWDEDFGDKYVGLYTEYRPGTETPHLAACGGHGEVGCYKHAQLVGGVG